MTHTRLELLAGGEAIPEGAVLYATLGDIILGGWATDDEGAFREALTDELAYVGESGADYTIWSRTDY